MIKEPWFWRADSPGAEAVGFMLSPLSALYDAGRRLKRATTRPERPPAPVVCIGNATVGGVGKTPFALMLAPLLAAHGFQPAFLTRGYGGREAGPTRVDPVAHAAAAVGDEALLLAAVAPTVVAKDRAAGARFAASLGADAVIMDDGFQNPAVEKAFSILLIDAADAGGRLLPAGPYREPLGEALARADAVVAVSDDGSAAAVPPAGGKPAFSAFLAPQISGAGARAVAFCGIGRPARFFAALKRADYAVVGERSFPDHHVYARAEIDGLRREAREKSAALLTTAKDFARLPQNLREGVQVFRVVMKVDDPARLTALVAAAAHAYGGRRHV
jgi:tetraacyldisaccharide 4'-kinase